MLFSHPPICSFYMRVSNVCSLTIHIGIEIGDVRIFSSSSCLRVSILFLKRVLSLSLNLILFQHIDLKKKKDVEFQSRVFRHMNMKDQLIYVPSYSFFVSLDDDRQDWCRHAIYFFVLFCYYYWLSLIVKDESFHRH